MSKKDDPGGSPEGLFDPTCPEDAPLIEVGEVVTLAVGGSWMSGTVEDVYEDVVTLAGVRVMSDLSTPPVRGGKLASAAKASVQLDAVSVIVRGTFSEWS